MPLTSSTMWVATRPRKVGSNGWKSAVVAAAPGAAVIWGAKITSVERMVGERERIVGLLRERSGELRALGVHGLALFGSVARDEARADSDVDLLVDLNRDTTLGFGVVGLREELRTLLGRDVGLTFAARTRRSSVGGSRAISCGCSELA